MHRKTNAYPLQKGVFPGSEMKSRLLILSECFLSVRMTTLAFDANVNYDVFATIAWEYIMRCTTMFS